jgi:hypothetical protein
MAILDLQGMQPPSDERGRGGGHKSGSSRGCPRGTSTLSLLLC